MAEWCIKQMYFKTSRREKEIDEIEIDNENKIKEEKSLDQNRRKIKILIWNNVIYIFALYSSKNAEVLFLFYF